MNRKNNRFRNLPLPLVCWKQYYSNGATLFSEGNNSESGDKLFEEVCGVLGILTPELAPWPMLHKPGSLFGMAYIVTDIDWRTVFLMYFEECVLEDNRQLMRGVVREVSRPSGDFIQKIAECGCNDALADDMEDVLVSLSWFFKSEFSAIGTVGAFLQGPVTPVTRLTVSPGFTTFERGRGVVERGQLNEPSIFSVRWSADLTERFEAQGRDAAVDWLHQSTDRVGIRDWLLPVVCVRGEAGLSGNDAL